MYSYQVGGVLRKCTQLAIALRIYCSVADLNFDLSLFIFMNTNPRSSLCFACTCFEQVKPFPYVQVNADFGLLNKLAANDKKLFGRVCQSHCYII